MIIWPGLRRSVSAIQRLFNSASFYAPLTHSLVPERGTGSPTFTRATTATGQKWDEAGYLDFTALAGEMVFKGARRERNLFPTTETFSTWPTSDATAVASATTPPVGITSAAKLRVGSSAATQHRIFTTVALGAGVDVVALRVKAAEYSKIGIREVSVAGYYATFDVDAVAVLATTLASATITAIDDSPGWYLCTMKVTSVAGNNIFSIYALDDGYTTGSPSTYAFNGDGTSGIYITGAQNNDITGETDQTTIRPYVSVGVESAPAYHGSMVDGVKCYDTDRSGNPITTTTTYDAVTLNGVAGTYVSTPDSVAASITGDIDIRVKAALTDWTPATASALVTKDTGAGAVRDWGFFVEVGGDIKFYWFDSGGSAVTLTSSVKPTITDGASLWLRITLDVDNGAAGSDGKFYTSTDSITWTQLGITRTTAGVTNIRDSVAGVSVGMLGSGSQPTSGKSYQAQIYNGINGTLAVDFDASRYAGGTTLTGSTGETWTLNGNAVIHPTNYPLVGYVPWEARTSLALQSNAFTTTWTLANAALSVLSQNAVGPSGAVNEAWTWTDSDGANVCGRDIALGTLTAASYTVSILVAKTTGAQASYPCIFTYTAGNIWCPMTIDTTNGVATLWTAYTGKTINGTAARCVSHNALFWRVELTFTATAAAWNLEVFPAATTNATQSTGTFNAAAQGSAVFYGAQVELGSFATPYIPTTTVAVARNADVEAVTTSGAILAVGGTISLTYIPYHSPVGTIALWGTYVDASNYTAILHDATNLIFRKRIAGSNYDATIANAFVSGTTYKIAATWGAAGTAIYLDGVAGTPHANTTAAQIAATMQVGADGNSLQQPGAGTTNLRIWQRQLSSPEGVAVTA